MVALYEMGGAGDASGVMRQVADYRGESRVSEQLAQTLTAAFARHVGGFSKPYVILQPGSAGRWALSEEGWSLFRR